MLPTEWTRKRHGIPAVYSWLLMIFYSKNRKLTFLPMKYRRSQGKTMKQMIGQTQENEYGVNINSACLVTFSKLAGIAALLLWPRKWNIMHIWWAIWFHSIGNVFLYLNAIRNEINIQLFSIQRTEYVANLLARNLHSCVIKRFIMVY